MSASFLLTFPFFRAPRWRTLLTPGLRALAFCVVLCPVMCLSLCLSFSPVIAATASTAATLEGRGEVRGMMRPPVPAATSKAAFDVEGQSVTINAGRGGEVVAAGDASISPDAAARRNTLTLNGGNPSWIVGGRTERGEAAANKVVMNNGLVDQVVGGMSKSGAVIDNIVEITGGTVGTPPTGHVWGGYSEGVLAQGNTVLISGGKVWQHVYGAELNNGFTPGLVQNNRVEISGGIMGPYVGGGRVGAGEARGNSVSLSGTGEAGILVGGEGGGVARENFVEISGGKAAGAMGASGTQLAERNYVIMSGGDIGYFLSGAEADRVQSNSVSISGGKVGTVGGAGSRVTGGMGLDLAQKNAVTITGGEVLVAVQGGYSTAGDALENTVSIDGATTKVEQVTGGQSDTASAIDNAVYIKGGEVRGPVIGGNGTIAASGNYVEMIGGEVREIYAGRSVNGTVSGNSVTLSGGTVGSVWGGYTEGGDVRGNTVTFAGATTGNIYGGNSSKGVATGNKVVLNSGEASMLYGGDGLLGATGNTVEMHGGKVAEVYGGWSMGTSRPMSGGVATDNTVVVTGGEITDRVWGAMGTREVHGNKVFFGGTATASEVAAAVTFGGVRIPVTDNSLFITGGRIVDARAATGEGYLSGNRIVMSGGVVTSILVASFTTDDASLVPGTASGNTVEISGGTVGGETGSYVAGGSIGAGEAINNTVTLSGAPGNMPDLSGTAIYGGYGYAESYGVVPADVFTGNTLHVLEFQGKARTVANFEQYNFFLPAHIANGSVVMQLSEATDISAPPGKSIRARITGMVDGGARLRGGDVIHLLKSDVSFAATGMDLTGGNFSQGLTRSYGYELRLTADSLDAIIVAAETPPEVEAPTDGPSADGGLINGGGDLIAGQGMDNALAGARLALRPERALEQANPWGVGVFGVFTGGQTRYNTPSRLSLASTHYAVGLTKLFDLEHSELLLGAYLDAGFGSYATQRKAAGRPAGGDGDSKYYGGGALARYALKKGPLAGAYVEGTGRTGLVESSYRSEDLQARAGREVKYDRRVPYYSAHGGVGYVYPITENASVDIYGKFFWSRLEGSTQRIAGDEFSFLPLDSYRLRGGARVNYALADNFSLYAGAAYEHEFDGTPRARVDDVEIKGDSMRGGTGIGELGLSFSLGEEGSFSMDIGAQGFIGKREGIMGTMRAQFAF